MRFMFVFGAFAVVTILMVIGTRQRWTTGARGAWEPGARGRWEPGSGVPPRRYQREQRVLVAVGLGILLSGMILGRVLKIPLIGYVAIATYATTWSARIALINWGDATTPIQRVVGIAQPLALVAGVGLGVTTGWLWWLVIGIFAFVGASATQFVHRRRRSDASGTGGAVNPNDDGPGSRSTG